jgi:hypothetical protein
MRAALSRGLTERALDMRFGKGDMIAVRVGHHQRVDPVIGRELASVDPDGRKLALNTVDVIHDVSTR